MVEKDLEKWYKFLGRPRPNELNREEIKLVAELHAKYYGHKYHSRLQVVMVLFIKKWITELHRLV